MCEWMQIYQINVVLMWTGFPKKGVNQEWTKLNVLECNYTSIKMSTLLLFLQRYCCVSPQLDLCGHILVLTKWNLFLCLGLYVCMRPCTSFYLLDYSSVSVQFAGWGNVCALTDRKFFLSHLNLLYTTAFHSSLLKYRLCMCASSIYFSKMHSHVWIFMSSTNQLKTVLKIIS